MIPLRALLIGLFGWLIGCAALLVLFVVSVFFGWLFGSDKVDAGLAQLPTDDDEPVPYLPTECTDPDCDCEKAREVARANLREFQRSQWVESLRAVARADAEAVQR